MKFTSQAGRARSVAVAFAFAAMTATSVQAQEATHTLTIKDGKFEPGTLEVKAGTKFKLVIDNKSAKSAEFESSELNREKVVPAGGTGSLSIGPLKAGTYPFFDDFNKKNTGQIVAK